MNLEKILYGIIGMSTLVLIFAIIEHISIRLFNDPSILSVYVAMTLGVVALGVLVADLLVDWIKSKSTEND